MKLDASDPDIETIVLRLDDREIDLQPDFQRGEVWSYAKKQRLIDTILRGWHVPPIHLIQVDGKPEQVLDGQQRLIAIRDFAEGRIRIDGHSQPPNPRIQELDGATYETLPPEWKRRFNRFTIRVIRISDYEPGEPGELFFRLNQPTNLTSAEQRNALFGPAREQVKDLVEYFAGAGLTPESIGFSNSRMAYDDIVARVCATIELGSLQEKITAGVLAERYRSSTPFPTAVEAACGEAIRVLGTIRGRVRIPVRFNKATLFSWLVFAACVHSRKHSTEPLHEFMEFFEGHRRGDHRPPPLRFDEEFELRGNSVAEILAVYTDRSTARVADVSSVLLRDAALWVTYVGFAASERIELPAGDDRIRLVNRVVRGGFAADEMLSVLTSDPDWGRLS